MPKGGCRGQSAFRLRFLRLHGVRQTPSLDGDYVQLANPLLCAGARWADAPGLRAPSVCLRPRRTQGSAAFPQGRGAQREHRGFQRFEGNSGWRCLLWQGYGGPGENDHTAQPQMDVAKATDWFPKTWSQHPWALPYRSHTLQCLPGQDTVPKVCTKFTALTTGRRQQRRHRLLK
jgi:hypothetical protein